jgi:hypothetical protein
MLVVGEVHQTARDVHHDALSDGMRLKKEKCELMGHSEWVIQEHVLWTFLHQSGIVALHVRVLTRHRAVGWLAEWSSR